VRIVGAYLKWCAKHCSVYGNTRMLYDWCDYGAHKRVGWVATVRDKDWGQSCFRHTGALAIDAMREGSSTIRPVGGRDRGRAIRLD
jgi:hypothetical protein